MLPQNTLMPGPMDQTWMDLQVWFTFIETFDQLYMLRKIPLKVCPQLRLSFGVRERAPSIHFQYITM